MQPYRWTLCHGATERNGRKTISWAVGYWFPLSSDVLRVKLWPRTVTVEVLKRFFFLPICPQTQPLELTVHQTVLCPLLEEYTPFLQPMCQGEAFCFTCQELSSNGSFPFCMKWASPPTVSERAVFFGKEATDVLSHLEKTTHILLFRHKLTVSLPLWKSGLHLLQLLAVEAVASTAQIGKQNLSSTFT